jgi:hypothetical protein
MNREADSCNLLCDTAVGGLVRSSNIDSVLRLSPLVSGVLSVAIFPSP